MWRSSVQGAVGNRSRSPNARSQAGGGRGRPRQPIRVAARRQAAAAKAGAGDREYPTVWPQRERELRENRRVNQASNLLVATPLAGGDCESQVKHRLGYRVQCKGDTNQHIEII